MSCNTTRINSARWLSTHIFLPAQFFDGRRRRRQTKRIAVAATTSTKFFSSFSLCLHLLARDAFYYFFYGCHQLSVAKNIYPNSASGRRTSGRLQLNGLQFVRPESGVLRGHLVAVYRRKDCRSSGTGKYITKYSRNDCILKYRFFFVTADYRMAERGANHWGDDAAENRNAVQGAGKVAALVGNGIVRRVLVGRASLLV